MTDNMYIQQDITSLWPKAAFFFLLSRIENESVMCNSSSSVMLVLWSIQVCELDIIFNFEKAYFILDEFLMGGEVQETSKVAVALSMEDADTLQEVLQGPLLLLLLNICNVSLCLCSHHRRWRSTWANLPTEPRGAGMGFVLGFVGSFVIVVFLVKVPFKPRSQISGFKTAQFWTCIMYKGSAEAS